MNTQNDYPTANPMIITRKELDDWGILFDPDANETFALDPTALFIWSKLDGKHSREEILSELTDMCEDGIPEEAIKDYNELSNWNPNL